MSYYHGLISSRRANSLLNPKPDGSFLIRDSQSSPGSFVLSAKCGSRMYHVLIFQTGGKYKLDIAGDNGDEPASFDSLDDLVMFLIGHDMKIDEDEIHLKEVVPCSTGSPTSSVRISSNAANRSKEDEDSDLLTDLFSTLFGNRCVIICVAHSKMSFDGKDTGEVKKYLAVVAKDSDKKGFYIRIVDKEEKCVVGEKRLGKKFQYDMPSDLVMTYISENGITCIGFRDVHERDRFLHQVDRIVRLQQDRAVKLRGRVNTEPQPTSPKEVTGRLKASEFDVENLTPEWQYLFDQAGVTKEMLQDKSTLQFVLDKVFEFGGEPEQLSVSMDQEDKGASRMDEQTRERMQAITLDANLKKESIRASRLSEELVKHSLKSDSPLLRAHVCSYLALCERFKDYLIVKHALIALAPEKAVCFCEKCAAGKPLEQVAGSPPQQYTLPLGWCQFVHKSQTHSLSKHFCSKWHVAYCSVPKSRVAEILRTGHLLHSDHPSGEVKLSPDIECACKIAAIQPGSYQDKVTGKNYQVYTVFQVYIQPDTYIVHVANEPGRGTGSPLLSQMEWRAPERTYIMHSLLIKIVE